MRKTSRGRLDPIHGLIEAALQPGRFISYGEGFGFISILEGVANQVQALLSTDSSRAVALYEVFLAGSEVRRAHHRKHGFPPGFNRIVTSR